jgi:hypothetical protein
VSKELKLTSADFYNTEDLIEDAVLDAEDPIQELKRLSGVSLTPGLNVGRLQEYTQPGSVSTEGSNISKTAMEKVDYQNANNVQPGSPDWFRLWFSKPYLTGENPW